ncbi:vacuolar membrane-associated protein iml1, partial [Coemansia sp. RSA 2603]
LASLTPSALMQIRFTTLYPAPYAANQLAAYMHDAIYLDPARPIALPPPASQLGLGDSLSPESPFAQLAHALQHSRGGIGLRNVRWHDERLSAVFAGYQLVDWMLVNFASVGSRAQALAAGARLVDRGLVVSAQGRPGFMDGHHFYAFTDAAVACRAAPRHGRSTASPAPSRPASRQGPDSALQAAGKLHVRTDASAAGDASGADAAAPGDAAVHASTAPSPLPSPGAECVRTPDVFPRLAARRSRRALPKTLAQSRTFTLDLDQQRRSPRTEHCVVHLDAVQNPTTCFHLSINWLSCTNALVDELVRGWGRMAERCGMRLVEAPRAHDAEDTHPFHSPIPIALALPPPPAERIFDAEWASAFGFFGDTDSEPESSSDDSASEHALDWVYAAERTARRRRTRTLKRMRRCIPTFPFERELLDEQDFVLDVEAEDCFPDARLLHREYTFERQGYAHTQYVHRSGAAFVQICGPGQFLWINNHLYTAHQAHHRPQHPPLASAPSQMSLGAYGATAAPDTSAASTPLSSARPPPAKPSTAASAAAAAAAPDACPPSPASAASAARMVPAFYPMRRTREMWPHQIHRSLAMHKLPHRTLEIPEWYSLQVVDRLGTQPADFDSVNAAITRVAVMRQAEGPSPLGSSAQTGDTSATDACFWSPGAREPPGVEHVASPAFNEARGQWAAEQPPASAAPQPMPTETNPDVLRANFIEVCRDQNSLEMLWQQTIGRYRNAWRAHCAGTVPDGESPKSKPMVVDMFSEGMWQA